MRSKLMLLVLFVLLGIFVWTMTPISASYYYSKGVNAYNAQNYSQALSFLERAYRVNKSDKNIRFYYIRALAKADPTYSVEKKIYEIANSDIEDEAKEYAKSSLITLKRQLLKDMENNYIYNAVSSNEVLRWDIKSFPLKVYVDGIESVPEYYKQNIDKALAQWTSNTGFIKFAPAAGKSDADIYISFKDFEGNCKAGEECHYTIAYTEPVVSGRTLKQMTLTFHRTKPDGDYFSPLEVYNTALHELGHTLGILGHSDNPNDVMYSNNEKASDIYAQYRSDFQYLSMDDLRTIALLYRLAPGVTNTNDFENESFYYPPVILGSSDEVLQKKLVELQRYIDNYPNLAAGYINIASVYADLSDFEKAFSALAKAESLSASNDEKYLIEYNRAVISYNQKDFSAALTYANKAKSFKTSPELEELISAINDVLK